MAYLITDDCIDCNACEIECPNNAIYGPGAPWELNGTEHPALNDSHTYIAHEKCTECVGNYESSRCVEVSPIGAPVPDPDHEETKEQLMEKWQSLHTSGTPAYGK